MVKKAKNLIILLLDNRRRYFIPCRYGYVLKSHYLIITHLLEAKFYRNEILLKSSFFLFSHLDKLPRIAVRNRTLIKAMVGNKIQIGEYLNCREAQTHVLIFSLFDYDYLLQLHFWRCQGIFITNRVF